MWHKDVGDGSAGEKTVGVFPADLVDGVTIS